MQTLNKVLGPQSREAGQTLNINHGKAVPQEAGQTLPERIGIIAGRGRFPVLIAEKIRKANPETKIFALGFKGESGKEIKKIADGFVLIELGMIKPLVEHFKALGVNKALMAGLVSHKRIFDKKVKFDAMAAEMFGNIKDWKADSILGALSDRLAAENIEMLSAANFLEEHMASKGLMTSRPVTDEEKEDMDFGFTIAKEISRLDTGQSLVVRQKCVVAIESLEGTDMCIIRGGRIAGPGAVVVKVAKLHQDLRFDLPVIGIRTLKMMKKIKSKAIAVESGKTCLIDREKVIETADKYGISIVGM